MNPQRYTELTHRADAMVDTAGNDGFGQDVAHYRLNAMARQIASGVGDGTPVRWTGFVWYRPEGLFQQNLIHFTEKVSRPQAA